MRRRASADRFFPCKLHSCTFQTAGALGMDVVRMATPQVQPGAPGTIARVQMPGWPTLLDSEIFTLTSTGLHAGQPSAQCRTPVSCRSSPLPAYLPTHMQNGTATRQARTWVASFCPQCRSCSTSQVSAGGQESGFLAWTLACALAWLLPLAPGAATNNTAAGRHSCNSRSSSSLAGSPAAALPPLRGRCPCRRQASWVWVTAGGQVPP